MVDPHILLLTLPIQGAINPSLQFAKHLIRMGVKVTIVTSLSAHRRITKTSPTPEGLTFAAAFSDGYDDGFKDGDDWRRFRSEFKKHGSQAIEDLITTGAKEGRPVTGLVYTTLQSWAAEVARDFHIPTALLWTQAAFVFGIYYYYFNGYGDRIRQIIGEPSCPIELPGLPQLTSRDLPSFLVTSDSNMHDLATQVLKEQLDTLYAEAHPKILVNTFDELELEALRAIDEKLDLIAVGPLVPTAFLDGKDPSDTSFGGDLFQKSAVEYWLDSKPQSSIVYVSFGSMAVLSKQQMEEIARGLLESHRPFLWVIRATEKEEDKISCREELEQQGMIVPWCSQVEVLSHPSLGCFVTHCGWNSSLESLVCGVPVVGFPQITDQPTNAKLIEDVFKTGVRVTVNQEGIVEGDEINRCIDMVMGGGEEGEEMKRNAKKWKDLAKEAAKEGGSLDRNLGTFVNEVKERFK